MKRLKQVTLFGLYSKCLLIILCLNDLFVSHHIPCLQEWLVQVFRVKQRTSIMDTAHPRGVTTHPIPPGSAPVFIKLAVIVAMHCSKIQYK